MSRKLRLEDLTDDENGVIRTALRFYLRHVEKGRKGLVQAFGDQADLSRKDAQLERINSVIARIKNGDGD